MLGRIKARKDKSLAPNILGSMTVAVTLSDRLKQAGIRECESGYETKTGNLSQNRKNQPKKGLVEKRNERNKKLQNLYNEFYSPYFKDCYQGKTSSKNCGNLSKTLCRKIRGSAKKTIFASLDFIKDCQKYKKKVINPEKLSEFKRERRSESVFSNYKRNICMKEEPQKLHASKTYSQIPFCDSTKKKEEEALVVDNWNDKEAANSCVRKDPSLFDQNTEKLNMKEESINDERKSRPNKKVSETSSQVKPFFDEFPSGDIAKIDKKYLQSLLSITKAKDKKYTNEDESKNKEAKCEKQSQKKGKKKSNEVFPENKVKIKKSEEINGAAEETKQIPSCKKSVLANILRDSIKSEAQIFVQKNKLYNQRNSEMRSEKNMAKTKPEVNDTRKNRKNRNKSLKNKNEELIDSAFPNEIPKITDIKELWRRDFREKSEISLSSNSSCTVNKNDADSEQKSLELEPNKVLKKLVEEEVKKMSNESEKKNNLKEIESMKYNFKTNKFKSENLKESENVENICKKLKISMTENLNDEADIIKNEMSPLKKKLVQAKHPQHYTIYEGEKINSTLLSALAEDTLKDQKGKEKLLKEKGKSIEKTQSQIINNWSILNRLEQAFLALGTPNFQGKNIKNSKPSLKGQELISNEKISTHASRKDQNRTEKISKEPQKSKEIEKKNVNSDASNTSHSTLKTLTQNFRNKKPEDGGQRNLIKNNQQKNKFKKEFKNDSPQNSTSAKIAEGKRIFTDQEKKKLTNQTTLENFKKKSTVKLPAKPNVTVHKPKQSARKQDKKSSSVNNAQAKKNEPCKKKLSKVLVQNKNSSQSLGKKTFDIIQKKYLSPVQQRKSKSCDKIDNNSKLDNVKICFSQIKNQDLKKNDLSHKNMKDKPQSGDKYMKNEAETKVKSLAPKKSAKTQLKTKPEYYANCKCIEMNEILKVSRESSEKILKDITNQEKPCENEKEIKEFPGQMQEKKVLNNSAERIIKERSKLSLSGKQQNPQESVTILTQREGKNVSDVNLFLNKTNSESFETEKSQNDLQDFLESLTKPTQKISYSNISRFNISHLTLTDSNSITNQKKIDIDSHESNLMELSKKLTSLSDFSGNNSISTKISEIEMDETSELDDSKCQTKRLWERDIRHYSALVKEIMSHYNRISEFLTHSDYLQSFPTDSADLLSIKDSTDTDSMPNKPLNMNLHEYRKRIISEYQALPIFEYKKLLQEKKEENLLTKEATKRNLTVVKDVTTEMDLDVKDFQPKIHKVLDTQLYVDLENLNKRNHPTVKFKEKKSSLQEIVLNKNEKIINQKCFLRATSTTKTFSSLPSSSVCVVQKLRSIKNFEDDLTETITSTSMEETESEGQ